MEIKFFGEFVAREQIDENYIQLFFDPQTWELSKDINVPAIPKATTITKHHQSS